MLYYLPMKRVIFYSVAAVAAAILAAVPYLARTQQVTPTQQLTRTPDLTPPPDRTIQYSVQPGDTFGQLAETAGVSPTDAQAMLATAADIHPLSEIKAGKPLRFTFDSATDRLKTVEHEISTEEMLLIERTADGWHAEQRPIAYDVRVAQADGVIASSLYETMLENKADERLAIALSEVFAWQVDFAVDVRTGDSFHVLYKQRYRDGAYVMPGIILKATFTNAGTTYTAYHFADGQSVDGYYDAEGKSLQRLFLKSPLTYRYISSGFTGARWDPIWKKMTAHFAIDYAARAGTPTVSVGDGTVTQAGWNDGYGISLTVRHNETFSTRYGHFSRIAKGITPGVKVKQNQVIGYAGSTGHSTGPHLHYEMYRHGVKVNPFTVDLPAGTPVPTEMREAFAAETERLDRLLP